MVKPEAATAVEFLMMGGKMPEHVQLQTNVRIIN
jgi:hypothetical protein